LHRILPVWTEFGYITRTGRLYLMLQKRTEDGTVNEAATTTPKRMTGVRIKKQERGT
jgi:hypothetical protein